MSQSSLLVQLYRVVFQQSDTTVQKKELERLLTPINEEESQNLYLMLNAAVFDGETLLHCMVKEREMSLDAVEAVLKAGANPNMPNNKQQSSFLLACYLGRTPLLPLFQIYGADLNGAGMSGDTPLLAAISGSKTQTFHWLIEHGADIQKADILGKTPLFLAYETNQGDFFEKLCEEGASLKAPHPNGQDWFDLVSNVYPAARALYEKKRLESLETASPAQPLKSPRI